MRGSNYRFTERTFIFTAWILMNYRIITMKKTEGLFSECACNQFDYAGFPYWEMNLLYYKNQIKSIYNCNFSKTIMYHV